MAINGVFNAESVLVIIIGEGPGNVNTLGLCKVTLKKSQAFGSFFRIISLVLRL